MELECDLSAIKNEDLLRRMWQQTEDIDHKKEIRSHLYKLRESRLRDLYQSDIMAGNFAKDPFNPSHGDSLVGQNFQSLKSQEVRDSISPTRDLKFHSMTLNHPNTTGWDVQTSSEVSPDGRAYRTETVATTDGVEKINGGTAEFRGLNEQRASASHQGDDKNFVKKASENSNTHLQERIVVGDENSGRTEMKMSSTTTSSSSQVTSSSSAVEYGGGEPNDARYLMDNTNRQHPGQYPQQQRLTQDQYIQQQQQRQQQLQQQEFEQTKQYQQQQHQQRVQQQEQEQRQYTEEFNRNRQESSTSRNVDTQQTTEQNRRVVDVDKASPEYQKHVQYLMSQPGEIISNTVEYPKPNVKMITTVKRLPDGTIVKNKRYETEELRPAVDSPRQRTTSSTSQSSTQHRNEQQRREQTEDNVYNRQQNVRNNTTRRSEHDVVDNAEPFAHVPSQQQLVESHPTDHFTDEITNTETKFSSVKKSSRRFSTETTSETIEEFSDHAPPSHAPGIRGKPGSGRPPTQDFSTHGFPSVKPNKPTQEYPTERPHGAPQLQRPDFSTHGFPSVSPNKPTQEYPGDRVRPSDVERLNQRTVTELNNTSSNVPYGSPAVNPNSKITTTKDGDVIIVSSESTRSSKFKTNAERVIETEIVIDGDSSPNRGFPAVKQTSPGGRDSPRYGTPTREYPGSPRRPQPAEDFSTHGFPSVRSPTKQSTDFPANGFPSDRDVAKPTSAHPAPSRIINPDGSVTTISSETKKTIKHNTNREHIIETEIVGDSHQPLPSGLRQPDKITFPPTPQPTDFGTHGFPSVRESAPTNDAYRRQGTPTREYPSSPHKPQPSADFSTHGFPSVKDSAPVRESTPSRDYPSSPRQNQPSQDFSTHGFPSVRTPNKPVSDYSTPSGGFPSTRDTNAPKLMPTQSRPQPSTTTTQKSTATTDSSQRLISKERDVDATHRAFAASLRCSSPVDSPDHHRSTPRSSVSSTRTFRRDGREGSHDSETSRISSGTVTRSSPSKSVGKTVVTKQTVVKTRNVNGSNETIDLTPQRPTKSPSPNKATTTTTTRITTTRKSPTEVPKPDNQKSKQAENTFPIINEPLTITKTHFTANDASFLGNEVVEKPCIKKHFYKLGPSDKVINKVDERPTQVKEPTPTSTIGRTRVTSDTVAARRNIFENSSTPKGQKPSVSSSPSPVGRRPSYMDHTVSSLEHIRRDSLEVNKHNYSRKSSIDSESNYERRPNSAVKFDVPHKPQRTTSIPEDIDVESIFELEVLESLLETVTSYELRRRIRAQIRLVKKNLLNTEMVDKRKTETKTSKSISSTHKTSTYISNVHNEESDSIHEDIKTKKPYESKPSQKHSLQPTKGGRVPESKDVPKKLPYGYSESRYNKEVTRKTTTNDKTPNGRSESPKRPTKTLHERHHSPEIKSPQGSVKEVYHTTGSSLSTHKEYIRNEQTDYSEESFNSSRRVNQSSERFEKDQSRERSYSPETKSPIRDSRQSPDLKTKSVPGIRTKSPDTGKPTSQRTTSPQARTPKQRDDLYTISKTTTVKTTHSPERKSSKPRTDESTPIWADRKNLLKSPSSTPRKVPASPSMRTTATKTTTSKSTSQRQTQNRNFEEDSITSSYGIGPTDENGLPLFGIKALKKKKPSQSCEATEEVTGYVIEEKYYSDNKTKPKVERKEYIYSTNADELEEIKKTVEQSRKSSQDDVDVIRKFEKIDKDYVFEKPEAILPDSEDFTTSSKYVRRGSVKELSEKFIRKESSQSTTEKSAGYPKAGLILRTSRGPSTDPSGDSYETTTEKYTTTSSSGHAYRPMEGDSDDEYNVQLRQKQSRVFTDYDDNESEQRHLSTRSSSKSTRSFLNSSGETKVVTSMDDALERMRNADYVVEAGDTAEDQEARSLLNKFLGASVIMKGVESVLPTTKQTTTTTITKTSYADDDADSDLLKNKAVKTTRITKTTKSGSSSTPVTHTTCDIEEIWDEELLQALLEQATTYEERRKIRARLRDLMAEREEKKDLKSGEISENAPEVDESSASEYEEIIEEITVSDYSDAEDGIGGEEITSNQNNTISESKDHKKDVEKEEKETKETVKVQAANKPKIDKAEKVEEVDKKEKSEAEEEEEVNKSEEVQATDKSEAKAAESDIKASNSAKEECEAKSSVDKTDSNSVNDEQQATSTTEKTETKEKDGAVVTTTTKVTTRTVTGAGSSAAKPVSPFAKFRQLDKQSSQQSKSPSTPTTPGGTASPSGSARIFQFTDPALNARAATVKEQLLQWCQSKTQEYENVQITNFSASWSDGLAFCALIHHFLPDAFDYSKLTPKSRRHNFELAFTVADEKAGIAPLLDVEDMVEMKRPDWKCVFIYVQSIYRRFRNCQ
ncbi:mucin-2 isoform X2 [Anastrepha obliqua]|uniref:mucin-2 isoform X2 n=1 Tax=Anastrepha obliqua TaxID=95512 RepID=UPI00240A3B8C|nr:mucin-2 isoform X2 [Anastrepha obliqua]